MAAVGWLEGREQADTAGRRLGYVCASTRMRTASVRTVLYPYEYSNSMWSVGLGLQEVLLPPPSRARNTFWCAMAYGKPFIVSADALWIRTPLLQGCPA